MSVLGWRRRISARARGHSRAAPEHSERDSLGAGQAQGSLHPLGQGLEPVVERPDEPHEVEDLAELGSGVDSSSSSCVNDRTQLI